MSVVWKYELRIDDAQVVEMPSDADLLHVAEQNGHLCLWARVIPTGQRPERRKILIRGTGAPIWQQDHVGTVLMDNGLVWHVFDGGVDDEHVV